MFEVANWVWVPNLYYLDNSQDIDECRSRYNICRNGRCKNTKGSFTCECTDGYELSYDGKWFLNRYHMIFVNLLLQRPGLTSFSSPFFWARDRKLAQPVHFRLRAQQKKVVKIEHCILCIHNFINLFDALIQTYFKLTTIVPAPKINSLNQAA